ncbi:MAG: c-type cytochrome, partial [Acidobacteria bacterium]|nr:c-type cytochrome [Acidobacteriota bacterium]
KGVNYICWPTTGVSSVEFYGARSIPGWDAVLLITTLKRGSLYVLPLSAGRKKAAGHMSRYFQSENRYRDTAVSPDGRTIYIATDSQGMVESKTRAVTTDLEDKGAILAFTYVSESGGTVTSAPRSLSRRADEPESDGNPAALVGPGVPPQFTARQVAEGKKSYDSYCAVCHGSTLTNGTFGTPLAGEYFKGKWSGKSVAAFHSKSRTMPPAAPASLSAAAYANIIAYILEVNGSKPGSAELPGGGDSLNRMRIQ